MSKASFDKDAETRSRAGYVPPHKGHPPVKVDRVDRVLRSAMVQLRDASRNYLRGAHAPPRVFCGPRRKVMLSKKSKSHASGNRVAFKLLARTT
jgi:hypothetical protein